MRGDTLLFDVRASTFNYNPPRFDLRKGAVVAAFEGRAPLDKEQAKAAIEGLLRDIELHLTWQRGHIEPWNERLKRDLAGQIPERSRHKHPRGDLHAGLHRVHNGYLLVS
jgi:hypothetical protein